MIIVEFGSTQIMDQHQMHLNQHQGLINIQTNPTHGVEIKMRHLVLFAHI